MPFARFFFSTCARAAVVFGFAVLVAGARAESLVEVYQWALKNDPQFKERRALWLEQKSEAGVQGADLLPQVSFSGEYADSEGDQLNKGGLASLSSPQNPRREYDTFSERITYNLSLRQKIFSAPDWFEFRSALKIKSQAEAMLIAEKQDLIVRVAAAYFSLLRASEHLDSLRREERAIAEQRERANRRFLSGLTVATDVLEGNTAYHSSQLNRRVGENQLQAARENLGKITGLRHNMSWRLDGNFTARVPEPDNPEIWERRALRGNYALRAARLSMESSNLNLSAARSRHLPVITGSAQSQKVENKSSFFEADSLTKTEEQTLGIQVEFPLFTGGKISAQRRQSYQRKRRARAEMVKVRRQVLDSVHTLHHALTLGVHQIQTHKKTVDASKKALFSIRSGYETGIRDLSDVLGAEQKLYRAQRNLLSVQLDYLLKTLQIKEATGELNKGDLHAVNGKLAKKEKPPTATRPVRKDYLHSAPVSGVLQGRVLPQTLAQFPRSYYTLQLAAYRQEKNAKIWTERGNLPVALFYIPTKREGQETLYRLCAGIFPSAEQARLIKKQLPKEFSQVAIVRPLSALIP